MEAYTNIEPNKRYEKENKNNKSAINKFFIESKS